MTRAAHPQGSDFLSRLLDAINEQPLHPYFEQQPAVFTCIAPLSPIPRVFGLESLLDCLPRIQNKRIVAS